MTELEPEEHFSRNINKPFGFCAFCRVLVDARNFTHLDKVWPGVDFTGDKAVCDFCGIEYMIITTKQPSLTPVEANLKWNDYLKAHYVPPKYLRGRKKTKTGEMYYEA